MMPWIVFLFVGVLDMGFYSYEMITVENAARAAVLQTSAAPGTAADSNTACYAALAEMKTLPNMPGVTTCGTGAPTAAKPASVVATSVDHGGGDLASKVTIRYLSIPMIPIPGLLPGQITIVRAAETKVGS